uniref:Transmembrane protein n=1 Tax=Meloidogyne incognita TaxID=6306 RepID=A0A914NTM0_MELIC
MFIASGLNDTKSQTIFGSCRFVLGFLFWLWIKLGKRMGSRMKNIGALLPTKSQLPSSVKYFMANPRGSRNRLGRRKIECSLD